MSDTIDTSAEACAVACMLVSNPQGAMRKDGDGWQKRVNDLIRTLQAERDEAVGAPHKSPSAWYLPHPPISTPNGPGEWNVDVVWGEDAPDDKWRPLYDGPPQQVVSETEAAYGLLWRTRTADKAVHAARHSLMALIGKDGQRRGIQWALDTFGSNSEPRLEDLP